jgi:hypothetical protein
MTIKELKKILARVHDNSTIEVLRVTPKTQVNYQISNLIYDKRWDTWQIKIEDD